jgi:hypothetical protein
MKWVVLVLLPGLAAAQGYRPASSGVRLNPDRADVAASYTATPMALGALGSCAALDGTYASVDSATAQPYYCDGVEWNRLLTTQDLDAEADVAVNRVVSQAGPGERAFVAAHSGAIWKFGSGTGGDECAFNASTGYVECQFWKFTQVAAGQLNPVGSGTFVPLVASDGMKWTGFGLGTCNSTKERAVVIPNDSGGTTGHRTRMCLCASDGAATPAYYWVNNLGTAGTSTTCPFLEP